MYHVTVHIHEHLSLFHASRVLSGLYALQDRGEAEVRWSQSGFAPPASAVVQLTVADSGGVRPRRVAIDLLDRSDVLDIPALAACDVYFKRSYFGTDLANFDDRPDVGPLLGKVRAWGLNFACVDPALRRLRWQLVNRCFGRRGWRLLGRVPELRRLVQEARRFLCLPSAAQFHVPDDQPLEPAIVYQTRLWEPHETQPDDAHEVNRLRVAVVRALRQAFGNRFWGGFVSTPLACREYPDEVVPPAASRMVNYAARSRRALIGVYTRGLHHSTAFKLAEYLAGGKAIVAEGLRNEAPAPLAAGRHYVPFGDAEECVQQCRALLSDAGRCRELRRAAAEYYRRHVEPEAHLRWTLAQACEHQSQRSTEPITPAWELV